MDGNLQFVAQHGYSVLFLWVLAEQSGLPIPSIPILLAAGALSAAGGLNLLLALLLTLLAALIADFAWYQLGRRKGIKVLNFLCRISLEPDSCVRQTEAAFSRQGARSLLLAKFIPGWSTAAPPLAGIFTMPLARFALYDGLGALLWAAVMLGLGRIFSRQIEMIATRVAQWGGSLLAVVIAIVALYIAYKFLQRQLFLRRLRIARIDPEELKNILEQGKQVMIVDLRHEFDVAADPYLVTGALRLSPDELDHRHQEIPRDRDVILYCT